MAVGGGTRTGHILTTRNGRDWREFAVTQGRVATIAFGNGRFVAAHDAELMVSTDGERFEFGERLEWKGVAHARRSACGDTEAGFRFVIIGDIDLPGEPRRVSWRGATGDGTRGPDGRRYLRGARYCLWRGAFCRRWAGRPDGKFSRWSDLAAAHGPGGRGFFPRRVDRIAFSRERWQRGVEFARWIDLDQGTGADPCQLAWAREGFLGLGFSWGGDVYASRDRRK